MSEKTIRIITYEPVKDDAVTGQKGNFFRKKVDYFPDDDDRSTLTHYDLVNIHDVPIETLEAEMDGLMTLVKGFSEKSQEKSGMVLDEIELTVEIDGKGKIGILGSGAEIGTKGAIKLKFKRQS